MTPEQARAMRNEEINRILPEMLKVHKSIIDCDLINHEGANVTFRDVTTKFQKKALIDALQGEYGPEGWCVSWAQTEWGDHIEVLSEEKSRSDTIKALTAASIIICLIGVFIYSIC